MRPTNRKRPTGTDGRDHRPPTGNRDTRKSVLQEIFAADDLGLARRENFCSKGIEAVEGRHETNTSHKGSDGRQSHAAKSLLQTPTEQERAQGQDDENRNDAASQSIARETQAVALLYPPLHSVVREPTTDGATQDEPDTGSEEEETTGKWGGEGETFVDSGPYGTEETILVEAEKAAGQIL